MGHPSLGVLLASFPEPTFQVLGDPNLELTGLHWDPKQIKPGFAYLCFEKEEFQEDHLKPNSLAHWPEAVSAGAVCLVVDHRVEITPPRSVTVLKVQDLNRCVALLSKAFWGDPFKQMKVVGITGTNGKTTTCQMLDAILSHAGKPTGVIGTIGTIFPCSEEPAGHLSNPLAPELFRIGRQMADQEAQVMMMEVTSHGMEFERNAALDFDIGIFTNLSQDHLDHHGSMKAYKEAKLKFIQALGQRGKRALAVINLDDPYGPDFLNAVDRNAKLLGRVSTLTYGLHPTEADLVAKLIERDGSYSRFEVILRGNFLCEVKLPMAGLFNIYNGLAAFAAGLGLEVNIETLASGLEQARQVKGRFEQLRSPEGLHVYVDYAHTPDALDKILKEVKTLTEGKLYCVFGAGGDRDRTKRPLMGQIVAEYASVCLLTSDNPRGEDSREICRQIAQGIPDSQKFKLIIEPDRRKAIHEALQAATSKDAVLIAGKGHETCQIVGGERLPFSDRQVVLDWFAGHQPKSERLVLEIDRQVIRDNLALLIQDKPKKLKIMAVVKDDALGHGLVPCAQIAVQGGVEMLGVACLSEAVALRNAGLDQIPILLFGEPDENELEALLQLNLSVQVQSRERISLLNQRATNRNQTVKVHLKIDSGMGRYGVRPEEALGLAEQIETADSLEFEGLMTHFAQSDEADKAYAKIQWGRFETVIRQLETKGLRPRLVHACNSGGYLDLPFAHADMIRTGALLTGVYPSKVCRRIQRKGQELKPAMTLKGRVGFLRALQPGDKVGYGMHFTAVTSMEVAVLPVGYGDGYPRLRNRGEVLIQGSRCPIVGGNSMDATMVDVSHLPEVEVGEEVIFLGVQENEEITAMELAGWASTVTYQVLSSWTNRVTKRWV